MTVIVKNHNNDSELNELRQAIRSNQFTQNTSGLMPGLVQGNVAILPAKLAEEFIEFCELNSKPCPVIGFTEAGKPELPMLGNNLDIRIDLPEYYIFENGEFSRSAHDITNEWQADSVAVVLGCSYSFEDALIAAGYRVRNIDADVNVSMYDTNIPTKPTKHFSGNTVVSMRPFKRQDVDAVCEITASFSKTHGAPIYIGDPEVIGIKDINKPDYGEPVTIHDDEVPVFWGCGVTSQRVLREAKLPLLITHAPGKMLIADIRYNEL